MDNTDNKTIVTSYRLTQDTKDKLQQQLKDLGLTQEQYFSKVASLMELENVKQNSFLSKDTTIIQSNLDAILKAFVSVADSSNNLISNKDQELEELKAKYKDMLFNKDNCITSKSEELQGIYGTLDVLQLENNNNKIELDKIRIENAKQIEQLQSNLADKTSLIEQYKSKNDMLLSDLQEYKQYKTDNESLKVLIADLQAEKVELNNNVSQSKIDIETISQEVNQIKKENELNTKLKIAEIREEFNLQISNEQEKHNKQIQEYQDKYKTLLEQLEAKKTTPRKSKKQEQEGQEE